MKFGGAKPSPMGGLTINAIQYYLNTNINNDPAYQHASTEEVARKVRTWLSNDDFRNIKGSKNAISDLKNSFEIKGRNGQFFARKKMG